MAVREVLQKRIVSVVLIIHTRMIQAKLCSVTAYAMLDSMKMTQLQVRVQCVQQGRIVWAPVPTKAGSRAQGLL